MFTKWNGNRFGGERKGKKSDEKTTCKLYPNKYNVCIHPPCFEIAKIKLFRGIFFRTSKKTCMIDLRGSMAYGSTIGDNNTY